MNEQERKEATRRARRTYLGLEAAHKVGRFGNVNLGKLVCGRGSGGSKNEAAEEKENRQKSKPPQDEEVDCSNHGAG